MAAHPAGDRDLDDVWSAGLAGADRHGSSRRHRLPRQGGAVLLSGETEDGVFGPPTEQAVQELQDVYLPPADGIVGPRTWHLLTIPTMD